MFRVWVGLASIFSGSIGFMTCAIMTASSRADDELLGGDQYK